MSEYQLLGKKCKDRITRFEGVCVAVVEWMYGCKQFILQPECTNVTKKEHTGMFYEKQLVTMEFDGLEGIEIPEYTEPVLFGKECMDKVTKQKGICIGRVTWLFASPQYVLEFQPLDQDKDTKILWLDEGRVEEVPNSENCIDPEDVQGDRPGGVMDKRVYPSPYGEMETVLL